MKIIKPKIDNRKYIGFTLENNIKTLLIIDPTTHLSSASLTVNIGSYEDPKNLNGLAHFLEHMLFMGTEKYKNEDYFMKFINNHGGTTNAFTMNETTTYFYDIQNEFFLESLDIFCEFFKTPIFSKNSIEKELKAIESEHLKNISNENWRLSMLLKTISNKNYPFSKFSTGNNDYLLKDNIRDELISFFNKYYSSNLMTLVIYHNSNIVNQITKLFKTIKNKNINRPIYDNKPFNIKSSKYCNNLIKYIPVIEENNINILWQIDSTKKYINYKPLKFLGYIINNKNDTSLYNKLKQLDYIDNIEFSSNFEWDSKVDFINIRIILSKYGFKNISKIISIVDNYINFIKNNIHNMKYIYNELKKINQNIFDYLSKMSPIDYTSHLSLNIIEYDLENCLYGPFLYGDIDIQKFIDILSNILNNLILNNSIIFIGSKEYINNNLKTEKYYGTKYEIVNDPSFLFNKITNTKFNLIKKNIYIPSNSNLNTISNIKLNKPKLLINKPVFWYYPNLFNTDPQIYLYINIYNPIFYESPLNYIKCIFIKELIISNLIINGYDAYISNNSISIDINEESINIKIISYNEIINKVLNLVIDNIKNIEITELSFKQVKEYLDKYYKNIKYESLIELVNIYLEEKICNNYYSFKQLHKLLDEITISDINEFKKNILIGKLTCLIQGNISLDNSYELIYDIKKTFKLKTYNKHSNDIKKLTNFEVFNIKKENIEEPNNIVNIFYYITNNKEDWLKKYATMLILYQITNERFFNKLRTEEQNGYIVKEFIKEINYKNTNIYGISFIVQSINNTKLIIESIFKFIKSIEDIINNITEKEYNKLIEIIINNILKTFDSQLEEFNYNINNLINNTPNIKKLIEKELIKITKNDLLLFYKDNFINKYNIRTIII